MKCKTTNALCNKNIYTDIFISSPFDFATFNFFDYIGIYPEFFLLFYTLLLFLVGIFLSAKKKFLLRIVNVFIKVNGFVLILIFFINCQILYLSFQTTDLNIFGSFFNKHLLITRQVLIYKGIILFAAFFYNFLIQTSLIRERVYNFEFVILLNLVLFANMILLAANSIEVLILSLELQGLIIYIFAAFNRLSIEGTEGAIKYFIYGAISFAFSVTGLLIYYLYFETTKFSEMCTHSTVSKLHANNFIEVGYFIENIGNTCKTYRIFVQKYDWVSANILNEVLYKSVYSYAAQHEISDLYNLFEKVRLLDSNFSLNDTNNFTALLYDNFYFNEINSNFTLPNLENLNYFDKFKNDYLFKLASILILLSFLLKLGVFPFHFWVIDLYNGAPMFITFFFLVFTKIGLIGFFIKFIQMYFYYYFIRLNSTVIYILLISCVLISLIFSSFGGFYQTNIKRLFAYSTIGNMSIFLYLIMHSNVNFELSCTIVIFFLFTYVIALLGFFGVLLNITKDTKKNTLDFITDLTELGNLYPFAAFLLSCFIFAFIGLPPFFNFFVKFEIFVTIITGNASLLYYILFLLIAIFQGIGSFYYLKLIKIMFFDKSKDIKNLKIFKKINNLNKILLIFLLFLLLIFPFYFKDCYTYLYNILLLDQSLYFIDYIPPHKADIHWVKEKIINPEIIFKFR